MPVVTSIPLFPAPTSPSIVVQADAFGLPGKGLSSRYVASHYGGDPSTLVASAPYSYTSVNAEAGSPSIVHHLHGPMTRFATSSSTPNAGDGIQRQYAYAAFRLLEDRVLSYAIDFALDNASAADFAFGFCATDSTVLASDPTDYVMIRKLSGGGVFLRSRKASGTPLETELAFPVLSNSVLYRYQLLVTKTGLSQGVAYVYFGEVTDSEAPLSHQQEIKIASQLPDTVNLAPTEAWRVGTSLSQPAFYVGAVGIGLNA